MPIARPITAAITTDASTTNSVVRAPTSTWLNRSLPAPSVPNQWRGRDRQPTVGGDDLARVVRRPHQ